MSGARPTGRLHLGHLVGVLLPWAELSKSDETFFEVADLHALTTAYEKAGNIAADSREMVIDWLAAGAKAALVKGGHLHDSAIDVLADSGDVEIFEAPRIAGSLRGTGCLLACGVAAALARGAALRDAIVAGRALVRDRFVHAETIAGMRVAY